MQSLFFKFCFEQCQLLFIFILIITFHFVSKLYNILYYSKTKIISRVQVWDQHHIPCRQKAAVFKKKKKKNELLQCWFLLICPEFPLQLFHWTFTVTEIFKISDFLAREPTFLMILVINCKILVNKIRWNLHVIAILNQINCELFLITIERLLIIKITFSSVSFTFFFLHEILWSIVTVIHFQSFLTYVGNDKK